MKTLGDTFPAITLTGVFSHDASSAFKPVNISAFTNQWKVVFFWPHDFTFVCPTEIAEFGKLHHDFNDRETMIFGVSTDSEYVHLAWKQHRDDLRALPFPMLSDKTRELSAALGILNDKTGAAERATYILDPSNTIRFVMITDEQVGRNTHEVLRVLDALQTDELCPCNWQKGDATLVVA